MIQVAAIFLFAKRKRKRKRKNGKGVKRVAARNNNWWPEMNARKASNCTAMYVEYVDHMMSLFRS
jgi:hypothetical protein